MKILGPKFEWRLLLDIGYRLRASSFKRLGRIATAPSKLTFNSHEEQVCFAVVFRKSVEHKNTSNKDTKIGCGQRDRVQLVLQEATTKNI